jgi:hypothetical protein
MLAGSKLLNVLPKRVRDTTTDQVEWMNADGEWDAVWIFAWYQ